MVTKQQQLEYLARECHSWRGRDFILVSDTELGYRLPVSSGCHLITRQEWQQERDKMSSKPAQDNSWHERGELPPVGVPVELWWGGSFAYNCEFITRRGHHCVMWNLDADRPDAADYMNSEFRPLRTEREKAIDEMVSVILDYDGYMITSATAKLVARQLHDSGYHR